MTTTLEPNAGYCILINTFEVDPAKADALVENLSHATEQSFRYKQGFISANLHVSLDKRHVANYAQWRSKEDFDTVIRDPEVQVHMKEAAALAISFAPLLYTLAESHAPAG